MKFLSLMIIACAFALSASAQQTMDSTHHRNRNEYSKSNSQHGWYYMKDGKLMSNRNGTSTAITNDVTLNNGTTITSDGKVTWKDGKTETLQNGERIDMNGKIHKWNNSNHMSMHHNKNGRNKSMQNMSDSTR